MEVLMNYLNRKSEGALFLDKLPPEVLTKIFSFIRDKNELLRLASVCRTWRDLIHTAPQLWRNIRLKLCCDCECVHRKRALSCVQRFGCHFRDLSLSCVHHNNHVSCKFMAMDFRKVLLGLHQTTLTSLKITDLGLSGAKLSTVSGIAHVLTRMLSSLNCLKSFQMSSAQWPLDEGIKVIDTVLTVSRKTLKSLFIDGFFEPTSLADRPAEFDQVTNGILSLHRLTKLSIDYGLLTSAFVSAMSESHAGQLTTLQLVISGIMDRYLPKVSHKAWLSLTKACPTLKVAFNVDIWILDPSHSDLDILDPALPIYKLRLLNGEMYLILTWQAYMIFYVLRYIMNNFSNTLEQFSGDLSDTDETIDADFLQFVKKCQRLHYIKVSANFYEPDTVKTVKKLVQERRRRYDKRKTLEVPEKRAKTTPA
ncbi:uncharacterized protein LOC131939016 [Physella acuta]|uniref:uncharacterized protein LOC131939016 n=1 Tax=Physella acuta TaxID=109671 RepID=UPI0027DC9E6F|nr:uncharacterized protein LOC131939016 [Physella acuta]